MIEYYATTVICGGGGSVLKVCTKCGDCDNIVPLFLNDIQKFFIISIDKPYVIQQCKLSYFKL